MKKYLLVLVLLCSLQLESLALYQIPPKKTFNLIITFDPVLKSGLIDLGYISIDDLYLIVSDSPINLDSIFSLLSKKNYTTQDGIVDTIKKYFRVYKISEKQSNTKLGNKVNDFLKDCSNYRSGYFFFFNDIIKSRSSLIGFIIRIHFSFNETIKYKILNDKWCDNFPNECRVVITSL